MKIVRFLHQGAPRFGALRDDRSVELLDGDPYLGLRPTGETVVVDRFLAPIEPRTIVGIGLNYRHHAAESGAKVPSYPIVFYKNPSAASGPGDPIVLPKTLRSEKVDYECELAVVIGRTMRDVPAERALDYVLGYTAANDVSARDWQLEWGGGQWSRAKSFDGFCPLGPVLVTTDEIPDPGTLGLATRVNGETVQDWTTSDMIFDVPTILAFLCADTTLLPGTVILTGTPHGVGMAAKPPRWLKPGDRVEVEIERIGVLENVVQ